MWVPKLHSSADKSGDLVMDAGKRDDPVMATDKRDAPLMDKDVSINAARDKVVPEIVVTEKDRTPLVDNSLPGEFNDAHGSWISVEESTQSVVNSSQRKGVSTSDFKEHSANRFDILSQDMPVESALPKRLRKETLKAVESKQQSRK